MHFYDKDGSSCHEVVGKNGKIRPTRVNDAKSLNLLPSVTTIMDLQAKPALMQWMQNQILEAAIASPFSEDEWYVDGWKKHILQKSREIGRKAANRGNEIHDAMEKYFTDGVFSKETEGYIVPGVNMINEIFPQYEWFPEKSFAVNGFGGRVDLYGSKDGEYIIIDFKTKDKINVKDMVQYDDHRIQLAAYQDGLQLPRNTRRFNLFISTNIATPGLCKLVECTSFDKYRNIFYALKSLWQCKHDYVPSI